MPKVWTQSQAVWVLIPALLLIRGGTLVFPGLWIPCPILMDCICVGLFLGS